VNGHDAGISHEQKKTAKALTQLNQRLPTFIFAQFIRAMKSLPAYPRSCTVHARNTAEFLKQ
jgi:hypothetical protein